MVDVNQASQSDIYHTAIKLLTRREYSAAELQQRLLQTGFAEELIMVVLIRLQKENKQSDQRFVEMLIRSRQQQGYGPVRIEYELKGKGIESELLTEFLYFEDEVWFELAKQVRQKKFGVDIPKEYKAKAKQMQFLQYRGFAMSHITVAMAGEVR
ncbi:MAG: hypothetical protein A3E87_04760 [Gammaproteobacteria bacterium RIFCSPHIGHO2_12_FULL_35_23]|nr:MAG: hypothetical protein A3E87_04760 [Gammaproteobacteria bacterium RIFCSPHIGHO2_12_FULL_35_23]